MSSTALCTPPGVSGGSARGLRSKRGAALPNNLHATRDAVQRHTNNPQPTYIRDPGWAAQHIHRGQHKAPQAPQPRFQSQPEVRRTSSSPPVKILQSASFSFPFPPYVDLRRQQYCQTAKHGNSMISRRSAPAQTDSAVVFHHHCLRIIAGNASAPLGEQPFNLRKSAGAIRVGKKCRWARP
jgi:hypothetical protein